jgi:hypothetical protein
MNVFTFSGNCYNMLDIHMNGLQDGSICFMTHNQ